MLLAHSSLLGIGRERLASLSKMNKTDAALRALNFVEHLAEGETLVLPAFNYDFTKSRRFDVENDPPQVGIIPETAFRSHIWMRDHTPVFSFLSKTRRPIQYLRPFSEESFFHELVCSDGQILLIGTGLQPLTIIHYWEHLAKIPYRYEKQFLGTVLSGGKEKIVEVSFHVRPLGLAIDYDFAKLGYLLKESEALSREDGSILWVHAKKATDSVVSLMRADPLFLLAPNSRLAVEKRLDSLGRHFRIEDFE